MTGNVAGEKMIGTNSNQIEQDESVNVSQYIRTLKRGKWYVLLITILCLALGSFVAKIATPIYLSSSKIKADPQQPNANKNENYVASSMIFLFYNTQYEIIKSRFVAESVVDDLDLVNEYKKNQLNMGQSKATWLNKLKTNLFSSGENNTAKKPRMLTDNEIKVMLASGISSKLNVSGGQKSQIINISYESPNADKSTKIVNAISKAYIQFGLESRLAEVKNTEKWFSVESAELKTKLKDSENRLQTFRRNQKLVDTSQQQRDSNTRLMSLNNQLIDSQTQLTSIEKQFLQVIELENNSKPLNSLAAVMQNLAANDLVKDVAQLTRTVDELFERYGEKHPKMIKARSALVTAEDNLNKEKVKVVAGVKNEYKFAKLQVEDIKGLIDSEKTAMQQLQGINFDLNSLEREVENNQRIYESFLTQMMVTNINNDFSGSNVQVIDYATVPNSPIKPNKLLIIVLASIFGVFLGMVLVFTREALNNTFKIPETIEEKLALPALGITPIVKKQKGGAIPEKQYLDDSRTPFAESINTIRTGLLFSNIDNPPKTILVTSSTGSEGKSTLAVNLASAFSQLGKTLLLEVDLRKPSIAKSLQLQSKLGLTDLVMGSVTSADTSFKTDISGQFSVIPCGSVPRNPLELLSSQKFDKVFDSLKNHFDYIILDGPPTLPVSDSCILANKVDAVIFTVKAEHTKIRVAKEAISRLRKLNANVIGGVLTVAEPNKMSYYGDHYYSGEYYGVKPTATNE